MNEVNYFKAELGDLYVGGFVHHYHVALRFDEDVKRELTQQMINKLLPRHNSHDLIVSTYYWFLYNSSILQECSVEWDESTGCFVLVIKMNLRRLMTVCDEFNISSYNEILNKTKKGWAKKKFVHYLQTKMFTRNGHHQSILTFGIRGRWECKQ